MKTKRHGILAVTAAMLLITALFITNCMEPLDLGGLAGKSTKGFITLSVDESSLRTIMPTLPTIQSYSVELRQGVTLITTIYDLDFTSAESIEVAEGTGYTITVNAFIDGTPGTVASVGTDLAGRGVSAAFNVTETGPNQAAVTLLPLTDGNGEGTFTWNIVLPVGVNEPDSALMEIIPISGGSVISGLPGDVNPVDLLDNAANLTGTAVLQSGYYHVVITATKALHQTRTISEVLHVYENMNSSTPVITVPNLNVTSTWTITFNDIDGEGDSDTLTYTHGALLTADDDDDFNTLYTKAVMDTVRTDLVPFVGWYTGDGVGLGGWGDAWTLATRRVITSMNLYARWDIADKYPTTITLTDLAIANNTPNVNAVINFTKQDHWGGDAQVTLTISNFGDFDAGSVVWRSEAGTVITQGAGETFTINFDTMDYLNDVGVHYIYVEATTNTGTTPWSIIIRINVTL